MANGVAIAKGQKLFARIKWSPKPEYHLFTGTQQDGNQGESFI